MTLYIALLRGINVGGHRIKMERLRELFAELGLSNVRTHIQSGNVFFESPETDRDALTTAIEAHLARALGYKVPVFLRTPAELERSLHPNPFQGVALTPDTRFLVTFTRAALQSEAPLPIRSPKNDLEILAVAPGELFVVLHLMDGKWGNLERFLAQTFGIKTLVVTTRFYDTTLKILQASQKL